MAKEQQYTLRRLIAERNLDSVEDMVIDVAQPTIYIIPDTPETYAQVGNTRLGGVPDLPKGVAWPSSDDGLFVFVGQINLGELPVIHQSPLPDSGLLSFFYGGREAVISRVLYCDGDWNELEKAKDHSPDEFDEDEEFAVFEGYRVKMATGITLPPYENENFFELSDHAKAQGLDYDEWTDRYFALQGGLRGFQVRFESELSHVLGYASSIGIAPSYYAQKVREGRSAFDDYEPDLDEVRKWHLLFEVGSHTATRMQWSDMGFLQFLIHDDDVRIHDFSRTYACIDSG